MNYRDMIRADVLTQPIYEAGKPISAVAREFGLDASSIVKLASNENPLGSSPKGIEAAIRALSEAHRYPDGGTTALREALAAHHSLQPEQFLIGNGSNEVMVLLAQGLLGPGDEAVMAAHAFIAFKLGVLMFGAKPVEVPMPGLAHDLDALRRAITPKTKVVYFPNPNNPTGDFTPEAEVIAFARSLPDHVVLCYDEAYTEYLDSPPDLRPLIAEGRKIFCCRTFSKVYGLAALRVGYGYGNAELIGYLNRLRQPFNVGTASQEAAIAALGDHDFVALSREHNRRELPCVQAGLDALGIRHYPTVANFVLMDCAQPQAAFLALQRLGVIVRPVGGYGLKHHLRLSIGSESENRTLLAALEKLTKTQPDLFFEEPSAH